MFAVDTYIFFLVILQNTAQGALGGTQGRVQGVYVGLLQVSRLLDTISDLQSTRLVVKAVGARNKLFVLLLEGEPGFQIVFLGSGVVQCAGNDGHDVVWELQGLVELLGGGHHVLKRLPRILGLGEDKLLNLYSVRRLENNKSGNGRPHLLKLVNTEDTPCILSVGASLFTVACAVSSISTNALS